MLRILVLGVLLFTTSLAWADASPTPLPSPSPMPVASPSPAPVSNSEKYKGLEADNEERMLFTAGQDDKLQDYFSKSAHYASTASLLTPYYNGQSVRQTIVLDDTHQLQWVDNGVNQPSQILWVDTTQALPKQEIFSNFQAGLGISAEIFSISLSPSKQYLYVSTADFGSIDQVNAVVIDLTSRKSVANLHLSEDEYAWLSASTLLYDKLNDDGSDAYVLLDLTTGKEAASDSYVQAQSKDVVFFAKYPDSGVQYFIQNNTDAGVEQITIPKDNDATLVGNDSANVFFLLNDNKTKSQLLQFPRPTVGGSGAPISGTVLATETNLFLEKAWVDEGAVFVQLRNGADRWLRTYSNGQLKSQILVPDCCSISKLSWNTAQASAKVVMTSAIVRTHTFVLDLNANTWDQDPNTLMLTLDGVKFTSEVVASTSKDGTKIPMRLLHRADAAKDASHLTVLQFYGGFDLAGYLDPRFDAPTLEFLKQGGVYAAPALRGGNEFGPSWHTQAMVTNKIKTFEDLASAAELLASAQWTKPNLIALRGTSNGGLTASATALLFPNDFGLSIPIAGVDDLLAKDVIDSADDGWSDEYGSVAAHHDDLAAISPVENAAKQGNVKFLIVDGASDTRVNPVNSVKLAKAMEDLGPHPENVFLLTVADAGHWVESFSYQNAIALDTEIKIWTMIYDLGN